LQHRYGDYVLVGFCHLKASLVASAALSGGRLLDVVELLNA